MPLNETKPFTIKDSKGKEHTYLLSKIPALTSYEIVMQYPVSALPKIGNPELHMQIVLQIFAYVGIPRGEGKEPLRLETRELCESHIPDLSMVWEILREMSNYNWGFFLEENLSNFWALLRKAVTDWVREISMDSSQPSSPPASPL